MSASTPQASGTASMNADQGVPPGIIFLPAFYLLLIYVSSRHQER